MFAPMNKTTDSVNVGLLVDVREPDAAAKIADLQAVAQKWEKGSDNDQNLEDWAKDPEKVWEHFHVRPPDPN
jgi:hypothetical protein